MSLILCPECRTKISDKAKRCPYCGFHGKNPRRPISVQKNEVIPVFQYEIEGLENNENSMNVISYEENRNFVDNFGKWETIMTELPAIAEVIESMASKDHIMVAKLDSYVKGMITAGTYKLVYDKNGEILPTIRGPKGFVKQVRLEEMELSPDLMKSLNDLSAHMAMAQILNEIEGVRDAIIDIHVELQNDRLALAEGCIDKLSQARMIQDSRLRAMALINVINSATDAKRILMRNYSQNALYISEQSSGRTLSNVINEIFGKDSTKKTNQKASDALNSLVYITDAVQTECEGYAGLGEYSSCKECLNEFKTFIVNNKLNERDTLLVLNENVSQKRNDVVDRFSEISNKITKIDNKEKVECSNRDQQLTDVIPDGENNNEQE